jgi:hypothetical protein
MLLQQRFRGAVHAASARATCREEVLDAVTDAADAYQRYMGGGSRLASPLTLAVLVDRVALRATLHTATLGALSLDALGVAQLGRLADACQKLGFGELEVAVTVELDHLANAVEAIVSSLETVGLRNIDEALLPAYVAVLGRWTDPDPLNLVEQEIGVRAELGRLSVLFTAAVDALVVRQAGHAAPDVGQIGAALRSAARLFARYSALCTAAQRGLEPAMLGKLAQLQAALSTLLRGPVPLATLNRLQLTGLARYCGALRFQDLFDAALAERRRLDADFELGVVQIRVPGLRNLDDGQLRGLQRTFGRRGDSPLLHAIQRELSERGSR